MSLAPRVAPLLHQGGRSGQLLRLERVCPPRSGKHTPPPHPARAAFDMVHTRVPRTEMSLTGMVCPCPWICSVRRQKCHIIHADLGPIQHLPSQLLVLSSLSIYRHRLGWLDLAQRWSRGKYRTIMNHLMMPSRSCGHRGAIISHRRVRLPRSGGHRTRGKTILTFVVLPSSVNGVVSVKLEQQCTCLHVPYFCVCI